MVVIAGDRGGNMSNPKLEESWFKAINDDKISSDMKIRKLDYIIRLGVDLEAKNKEKQPGEQKA